MRVLGRLVTLPCFTVSGTGLNLSLECLEVCIPGMQTRRVCVVALSGSTVAQRQSRLLSLSELSARTQFLRTHEASINLVIIVLVVVDVAATAAFEFQAKAEKDCYGRVRIKTGVSNPTASCPPRQVRQQYHHFLPFS